MAAVFGVDHLTEQFNEHREELRVLSGHFPLCVVDVLDVPFATFTILRDPVERTLSLLRSRAQRGGDRYRGLPLEAIYEDPEIQDIARNHMVKMLSLTVDEMGPVPLMQPVVFDEERLELAKRNLELIDVVGLQERYEEFCGSLERRFGWDLGPSRFANRTESQPVADALRRRIAADNRMDVDLYEHARDVLGLGMSSRYPMPGRAPAAKIVITGTGRSGTTLLVQVLDELGLDTGLAEGKLSTYGPSVRAGLESRVDDPDAPTVVKDMTFGFRIRELLEGGTLNIRHVIIPDRRLDIATASRIRAAGYGRRPFGRGALTGTMRATEQEQVLAGIRSEIISALEDHEIPYTVLEFPRFASDAAYTHAALTAVEPTVSLDDVRRALDRCVRPEMIHERPLSAGERWRTRLTTAWMVLYRYPVAGIRRRIDPEGQQAKIRASVAAARRREQELVEVERQAGRLPRSSRDRPPTSS